VAAYKYNEILTWSNDQVYDLTLNPGIPVPHSGIYRCAGCGHEVASNARDPLPRRTSISTNGSRSDPAATGRHGGRCRHNSA
jgi:hypothetical protein